MYRSYNLGVGAKSLQHLVRRTCRIEVGEHKRVHLFSFKLCKRILLVAQFAVHCNVHLNFAIDSPIGVFLVQIGNSLAHTFGTAALVASEVRIRCHCYHRFVVKEVHGLFGKAGNVYYCLKLRRTVNERIGNKVGSFL